MSQPPLAERRNLQRIVVTTVAALAAVVIGAAALLTYAADRVDRVEAENEQRLVELRLERRLQRLVEDINSSAIWNDPVHVLAADMPDAEYLQVNFGDYYADYMDHTITLLYGRKGDLLLVSRESEPTPAVDEQAFIDAVAPLVERVRRQAAAKRDRDRFGFDAAVNYTALVSAGDEQYLVGLGTVVREDLDTPRLDNDPVVVSAVAMPAFITTLERDLALERPTYLPTGAEGEAGQTWIAVADHTGRPLGHIAWTLDHPGRSVLADAAPFVGLVLLLITTAAVLILVRVRRIVNRLDLNERELTEARDRAEAANNAKSRFLANMSHELRTPLNGVIGLAEVMAAGELSANQRAYLNLMRTSAQSLTRLIEHLLEITRLERREVHIECMAFEPEVSIAATVEAHRDAASAKGLNLICRADLPGRRRGDEARLRQVLGHLVENAIIYTERGEVVVSASSSEDAVRLTVSDTGMGSRADLKPDLFDIFVQGDDSITKRFDGVGLGLAICRNLVHAMGGEISVKSEEGRGSTFTIELPMPRAEPASEQLAA